MLKKKITLLAVTCLMLPLCVVNAADDKYRNETGKKMVLDAEQQVQIATAQIQQLKATRDEILQDLETTAIQKRSKAEKARRILSQPERTKHLDAQTLEQMKKDTSTDNVEKAIAALKESVNMLLAIVDLQIQQQENMLAQLIKQTEKLKESVESDNDDTSDLQELTDRISNNLTPLLTQADLKGVLPKKLNPELFASLQKSFLAILPTIFSGLASDDSRPFFTAAQNFINDYVSLAEDTLQLTFVEEISQNKKLDVIEKKLKRLLGLQE